MVRLCWISLPSEATIGTNLPACMEVGVYTCALHCSLNTALQVCRVLCLACSTVQSCSLQCNIVQYRGVQSTRVHWRAIEWKYIVQYYTGHCTTVQYKTVQCRVQCSLRCHGCLEETMNVSSSPVSVSLTVSRECREFTVQCSV